MAEDNKDKLEMAGLKVPAPLKQEFMGLRDALGMSHTEYAEHLITLVKSAQTEGGTDSPVLKEQTEIEQALAKVARICTSTLTLAVEKQLTYKEDADKVVEVAKGEVTNLKALVTEQKESLSNLEKEKAKQDKVVIGLQNQAESTSLIKEAWAEKETSLNLRIAELDTEAKEARELKKKIGDLEKELSNEEKALALAEQQQTNDAATLTDLRSQLAEIKDDHKEDILSIKKEHADALELLETRHQKEINSLETGFERSKLETQNIHRVNLDNEKQETEKALTDHQKYIVDIQDHMENTKEAHNAIVADLKSQIKSIKNESITTLNSLKTESKASVDKVENALTLVRADLSTATEALNAEKLTCAGRVLEIEKAYSKENGLLSGQISSLEKDLSDKKVVEQQLVSLESEKKALLTDNKGVLADLDKLKKELVDLKKAGTKKNK